MSRRNGDRARFHKDRKRKIHRRQRIREFMKTSRPQAAAIPPDAGKAPQPEIAQTSKKVPTRRAVRGEAKVVNSEGGR